MGIENYTSEVVGNGGLVNQVIYSFSQEMQGKIDFILSLGRILAIVMIIYFVILIISKLFQIKDSRNLSRISRNTKEINEKMSLLIKKKDKR